MDTTQLTHRRSNPALTEHVMLFAERGNEHYGRHMWVLGTDLPRPCDVPGLLEYTQEYYEVDADDALALIDPERIVGSAGAWDDDQYVSDVWQAFELVGVRTQDGAVVLDRESVELTYVVAEDW